MSSLSDDRIIRRINRHFIPAWVSRDHYQLGPMPADEQAEVIRLDRERARKHLTGGTVCVFIVAPSGEVLDTLPLSLAVHPDRLVAFLDGVIEAQHRGVRSDEAAHATAVGPATPRKPSHSDGRIFSVYTRGADRARGTSHDRVELSATEWSGLLPPATARPGDSWTVPATTSQALLKYGYPPLPRWSASDSRVREAKLTATVVSVQPDEVRVRFEGHLDLIYPYLGKPTDSTVSAQLAGTARIDPVKRTLKSFQLASEKGVYVWYWEGKPISGAMALAIELE